MLKGAPDSALGSRSASTTIRSTTASWPWTEAMVRMARHETQPSAGFVIRAKRIALIRELSFSPRDCEDRQRRGDSEEENRSARRQERTHNSHEINLSNMICRTKVPKEKIEYLKELAASAPNAQGQRNVRDEDGADRPGDDSKLFTCEKETAPRAAAGYQRDNDPGEPAGRKLASQRVRGREDQLVRAQTPFACPHGTPDEQRPNPGCDQEPARDRNRSEETGREQTGGDEIPPKADPVQRETQFRHNHEENAEMDPLRQGRESCRVDLAGNHTGLNDFRFHRSFRDFGLAPRTFAGRIETPKEYCC